MADGCRGTFAGGDSDAEVEEVVEAGSEEIERVDVRCCCPSLGSPARGMKFKRDVAFEETHLGPEGVSRVPLRVGMVTGMVAVDVVTNGCDRKPRTELYIWYLGCIITAIVRLIQCKVHS